MNKIIPYKNVKVHSFDNPSYDFSATGSNDSTGIEMDENTDNWVGHKDKTTLIMEVDEPKP